MKTKRYAAVLAALLVMTSAGCGKTTDKEHSKAARAVSAEVSSSEDTGAESQSQAEDSQTEDSKPEGEKKPAHQALGSSGAKGVTDVLLIPDEDVDISRKVSFSDLYGRHVLHSGVVGLVGSPVEVEFDTAEVSGGNLVFVYDPAQLGGVRPDALMFLYYEENDDFYQECDNGVLNTENCSMTLPIEKPGVYLLVNKYEWLNAWGAELPDNGLESGYDPYSQPIDSTMWEKNELTGDILELKDDAYIAASRQPDNSYLFEAGTPEQLASAVFVNNCATPRVPIVIELTNDIDLAGYEWASMGWYTAGIEFPFEGTINGNGHTIRNMRIEDGYYVGLVGFSSYCYIYDLNVEDAYVSGLNPAVMVGYLRNGSIVTNCHVSGEVNGSEAGAISSLQQTSDIIDCTADVIVNGEDFGQFLSGDKKLQADTAAANPPAETIYRSDDGVISREAGIEDKYQNLGWEVNCDGRHIVSRNARDETELPPEFTNSPGHYDITLTAFVSGYYIPVSNTLEFDVK